MGPTIRIVDGVTLRASENDNGEFWIDWKSIQQFFDVMYINWDPTMFSYKFTLHFCWHQVWRGAVLPCSHHLTPVSYQDKGPVKDLYNMQENPQYRFAINPSEDTEVFVLLSRHIVDISDFAENKEYITVHVYKGGRRIFYPEDPYMQGVKINRQVVGWG